MPKTLSREQLDALAAWGTCAVSNGIEQFKVRPRNTGYMLPEIKSIFPHMPPMIGYAVTGVMAADNKDLKRVPLRRWWEEVLSTPGPRVVVIQDIDDPVTGSFWGEVNGNIHKALGCVGVVTNGGVRDLDEVEEMGFNFFAKEVLVSHAHAGLIEIGVPVKLGGLSVNPGDLIMGDKHGVLSIPHEIAAEAPAAARAVGDWEQKIIRHCQSGDLDLDYLEECFGSPLSEWRDQ